MPQKPGEKKPPVLGIAKKSFRMVKHRRIIGVATTDVRNAIRNLDESLYEQFEYQLVYLRPTAHAEEQLTVGVIAMSNSGFELRLVSSVAALDLMTKIVGDSGVEQFHFAAGELRRSVSRLDSWESLAMTTDLLIVGEKISAFTRDRSGLLTSVLASASSLIRGSSTRAGEVVTPSPTMTVSKSYIMKLVC